jgi:formate hydrogenlyase subunit 3/multisubunit Na+/H+ antiporter MnhD subunit
MSGLGADAAWLGPMPWLPVLAPGWPLALLAALFLPPLRRAFAPLAPWAALPALILALAAPPSTLPLPGLMLGGSLQLDATGRWVLAAVALLWLAGSWLARDWLGEPRRAAAWLLALAGALWLPVAGDLPTALAASVLATYPLYGLLGAGRGARVLLATVVIADLLILESLLLLAKGGAGLDFDALRAALAEAKGRDIVLALLLIGFGAKAGLTGLHYWLAPALAAVPVHQFGPTVAFTLAAGLLPLLRLLPLGHAPWSSAAALLPWLAFAGCVWAVMAGLFQAAPRARTAYALSALASWWLGVLGLALAAPVVGLASVLPPAMALSALGIAALLLAGDTAAREGRFAVWALALLSALLVLLGVLATTVPLTVGDDALHWPLAGSLICIGVLLGASATLPGGRVQEAAQGPTQRAAAVVVAAGLGMAVLAILSVQEPISAAPTLAARVSLASAALFGGFGIGLAAVAGLARVPRVPAGDLLVHIEHAVAGLAGTWTLLGAMFGHWRNRLDRAAERLRLRLAEQRAIDSAERWLRRWPAATLLLLAASGALALLVRPL